MVQVTWSRRAQRDLDEICDYLANDSPVYAQRLADELFERSLILEIHPLIGKPVPEIGTTSIRELIHDKYRLIYWVIAPNKVSIMAVVHARRQLKPGMVRVPRKR